MNTSTKIILGVVFVFLFSGIVPLVSHAYAQIQTFKIVKVIDSQTFVTDIRGKNETVQLLGIQTPDSTQCFGKAATDKLKALVNGKSVILVNDNTVGNRDSSHNLIRYVYLPDSKRTFINGEMIKQGYAKSDGENSKLLNHLNWLESYAKAHSAGLWIVCPTPVVQAKVYTPVVYTAPINTYIPPTAVPVDSGNSTSTVQQSAPANACAGATAICSDGTCSYSAHHQGTCSHHGGVAQWL
jgi:endonuclease YncB( thermonuclease family)